MLSMQDGEHRQRHTDLDLALVAQAAPQQDNPLHARHCVFQLLINQPLVVGGKSPQMHALGSFPLLQSAQVTVDGLGQERRERRHQLREPPQHVVQRAIGKAFVRVLALLPEAPAVEADVPISEFVEEVEQGWHHVVETIRLHLGAHAADQRLLARQDPTVEDVRRVAHRRV